MKSATARLAQDTHVAAASHTAAAVEDRVPGVQLPSSVSSATLGALLASEKILIKQKRNWLEAATGFEMRNAYEVTANEKELKKLSLQVVEMPGGPAHWYNPFSWFKRPLKWLVQNVLGRKRPFTMEVRDGEEVVLRFKRPYRFYLSKMQVFAPNGQLIGTIHRHMGLFKHKWSLEDAQGKRVGMIINPKQHPWTFNVKAQGKKVGVIEKNFSGVATELLTNADNFEIMLKHKGDDGTLDLLAVAAIFAIDYDRFEARPGTVMRPSIGI